MFEDDFNNSKAGDYPFNFISNSGGEIVSLQNAKARLFYPNINVLPDIKALPENFAFEFDLILKKVPPSLYNTFFNDYINLY